MAQSPTGAADQPEIHKGLNGVVADTTEVSSVNPETNSLLYRGYPVPQLAEACSFEQVAHLLWNGELPTGAQLADLQNAERQLRRLEPHTRVAIDALPTEAHPMDVLRTAVSAMGAADLTLGEPDGALDATNNRDRAIYLFAQLPAVVAYGQRRRHGLEPIAPREGLGYAENFLYMTFGAVPDEVVADVFRQSLILYAEHSFNASTFTARVVASTLSDIFSAVTAAIAALKGPLHGGANEAVMASFDEIGSADNAAAWLDDALANRRKVMGFGHRVYKNGDSRVPTMRAGLERLVELNGRQELLDLYTALESAMAERKGLKPNLDYPSGPVYHLMGFDTETFTPLFAAARVVGWTAHIMEQYADNALIRPLSVYSGPAERDVPAGAGGL